MEAARFGGETARAAGGSFATGAAGAAGVLAREGVRAAVPTLIPRGNSAANRIAERRALQRAPAVHGYAVANGSPGGTKESSTSTDPVAGPGQKAAEAEKPTDESR